MLNDSAETPATMPSEAGLASWATTARLPPSANETANHTATIRLVRVRIEVLLAA
jgi:hypothetical protein